MNFEISMNIWNFRLFIICFDFFYGNSSFIKICQVHEKIPISNDFIIYTEKQISFKYRGRFGDKFILGL